MRTTDVDASFEEASLLLKRLSRTVLSTSSFPCCMELLQLFGVSTPPCFFVFFNSRIIKSDALFEVSFRIFINEERLPFTSSSCNICIPRISSSSVRGSLHTEAPPARMPHSERAFLFANILCLSSADAANNSQMITVNEIIFSSSKM